MHTPPTKVLWTTTFQPVVAQLSGALAPGVRLLDQFLHDEPTPQKMAPFERELCALFREVGRRVMAWVLHHVAPENDAEAPSRVRCEGWRSRRGGTQRSSGATRCGPVEVRRRLYAPLERGGRSIHPVERRLGLAAGVATPGFAERVGRSAADHTQRHVLER